MITNKIKVKIKDIIPVGIIVDVDTLPTEDISENKLYRKPNKKLYHYKDGWVEIGSEGGDLDVDIDEQLATKLDKDLENINTTTLVETDDYILINKDGVSYKLSIDILKTLINQDVIDNINLVELVEGTTLEEVEYEEGCLYYVTSNSDSFTKDTLYYGKDGGIMKLSASEVSLTPDITSFSVGGASGTKEVGSSTNLTNYSFTLKKYAKFSSLKITSGGATIVDNITPSSTKTENISYTLNNSTTGTKTITLTGTLKDGGTKTKSVNYSVLARQYYGSSSDEVLTSETGTTLFGNLTSSSSSAKTYLQSGRITTLSLSLGDTPTYIYFVIPTNMNINAMTSGPLSFPYIKQSNITITNSFGANVEHKVYRSANKVYGDVSITIS